MLPEQQVIHPSILYFGMPVVLVGTRNNDGSSAITPISSAWALGPSVVLGLGADGHGTANLLRERECSLNFPSADLWQRVERISRTTGRHPIPQHKADAGYVFEADKVALGGFELSQSETIAAPRVADCPLQFEARLAGWHPSAKLPKAHLIVEVEVQRVHAHRNIVVSGTNHIDPSRWNPLFYVFRHYFGNAIDLGKNFRAEI